MARRAHIPYILFALFGAVGLLTACSSEPSTTGYAVDDGTGDSGDTDYDTPAAPAPTTPPVYETPPPVAPAPDTTVTGMANNTSTMDDTDMDDDTADDTDATDLKGEGTMVVAVTDAAADMDSISSISMTVDLLQAYDEEQGWITLSSRPQDVDLLELRDSGDWMLLAEMDVPSGHYEQLRLSVSDVTIRDDDGVHTATMPSSTWTFDADVEIDDGETAAVTVDVLADESLYLTDDEDDYVFAPSLAVQSWEDTEADTSDETAVELTGGDLVTDDTFSMDINGELDVGNSLPDSLTVSAAGVISSD